MKPQMGSGVAAQPQSIKSLKLPNGCFIFFPISSTGQERYGNMTRVYYREAVGALVVFDMTRLSTFQAILKWKGDLDSKVKLRSEREREDGGLRDEKRQEDLRNKRRTEGRNEVEKDLRRTKYI